MEIEIFHFKFFRSFPAVSKLLCNFYEKSHFLQYFVVNIYVQEMEYIFPE